MMWKLDIFLRLLPGLYSWARPHYSFIIRKWINVISVVVHWHFQLEITLILCDFRAQHYIFRFPWVLAYQGVITFFVLANFTLATFMDPGVIPKGTVLLAPAVNIHIITCVFGCSPTWRRPRGWLSGSSV